jgi:hypothetical protein
MAKSGRRKFLNRTNMTALGTFAALNPPPDLGQHNTANMNAVVSFGLEMSNLHGNGADAYFRIGKQMILNTFNIDAAFMPVSLPSSASFAEVLCQGRVSRGSPPVFDVSPPSAAYLPTPASVDFGPVSWFNPDSIPINGNLILIQDLFYSVILKSWVPSDGIASASSRQVLGEPSLLLNAGDYLIILRFTWITQGWP